MPQLFFPSPNFLVQGLKHHPQTEIGFHRSHQAKLQKISDDYNVVKAAGAKVGLDGELFSLEGV